MKLSRSASKKVLSRGKRSLSRQNYGIEFVDVMGEREEVHRGYLASYLQFLSCRNCDHSPEDVLPACQLTLKNLQLDYIDLYLIHGPTHFRKGATIPPKDGDNFGYTPESISQCWEASY